MKNTRFFLYNTVLCVFVKTRFGQRKEQFRHSYIYVKKKKL